nr:thiamine pyrophosphate-dependent dehydrogenase E1 component subunit alpha [Brevibacterium siliguriense]
MCEHNPHWHEARGEEAVIVGGFAGLEVTDVVAPHFRGACAVALLRGSTPEQLAANVFGTYRSQSLGNWRGDICPSPSSNFIGMFSGSLGTSVSYATGAALHLKRQSSEAIAVCAFGDGTVNSGIVYESMNIASMLQLPIVYICQNNQYATSLPASVAIAGNDVSARARACGMPAVDVDGNDVDDVIRNRNQAVERARHGAGPSFIHAKTYRLGGHYMTDPEVYRTAEEVSCWEARDPLTRYRDSLADKGVLSHKEAQEHIASENQQMLEIIAEAKQEREHDLLNRSPYSEDWRAAS